jgi:hypothetical protein
MKITEILTEGPLDFAKKVGAFATNGVAGWQSQQVANVTSNRTNKVADAALLRWSELAQNINAAGTEPTTQQASAWFTKFAGAAPSTSPADINPKTMKQWLIKEINGLLANRAQGTASAAVASSQSKGSIGALGRRGSANPQAATSVPPYQSTLGVTVVQALDSGIILNYKNRNFMLNSTGQWALDGKTSAGATASEQMQAEMDKVAQSTGYM